MPTVYLVDSDGRKTDGIRNKSQSDGDESSQRLKGTDEYPDGG